MQSVLLAGSSLRCGDASEINHACHVKEFQETLCAGIVARFNQVRRLYEQLAGAPPEQWTQARCNDAVTVLCAPTGAGKTLIAVETMRRVSATGERVLWFWFAPFSGLVEQSRQVIAAQAPELDVFDLQSDRCWETVRSGGVFVVTWAAVAVRNTEGRRGANPRRQRYVTGCVACVGA